MRLTLALAALLPPAGLTTWASEGSGAMPGWLPLILTFVCSGALYALLSWRMDQRVKRTTAEKTQAERDSIAADVYDKMSRHVQADLDRMELRVKDAQKEQGNAQTRLATAQAELATAMARAAEDRERLQRDLHGSEERHQQVVEGYRTEIRMLRERVQQLEQQVAALQQGRRATDG